MILGLDNMASLLILSIWTQFKRHKNRGEKSFSTMSKDFIDIFPSTFSGFHFSKQHHDPHPQVLMLEDQ